MKKNLIKLLLLAPLCLASCADEPKTGDGEQTLIPGGGDGGEVIGFYVLNEGIWGQNNCTLDYYSYADSTYHSNIYETANPDQVLQLGDVGNALAINKGRLFVAVNGSHKVEVVDAYTAKSLGQFDVSSPRNLAFRGDSVFVTSQVGGPDSKGSVVCFNAITLEKIAECPAGYGPEEMAVVDSLLYVANSQVYGVAMDNTVTVINMNTMKAVGSIEVAPNLDHMAVDKYGSIWVNSLGDYANVPSHLYRLAKNKAGSYEVAEELSIGSTNFTLGNDCLYSYNSAYDANWNATFVYTSLLVSISGYTDEQNGFIDDEDQITYPYAIAVQPSNGDIFLTDARDFQQRGTLRCYNKEGKLKWTQTTGYAPGHIAFLKP